MAFDGLRKIRCPFCSNEYRLSEFAIYSENTGMVAKAAPKTILGRVGSTIITTPLGGKKNTLARNLRRCPNPNCLKTLPLNIEYVDQNITIAIIGDTSSGKSHFIAAMIKLLKERQLPPYIGLAGFNAASSEIDAHYRHDYFDPLFGRNEPLPRTPAATDPLDNPLIYEMRFGERRINLIIYDASGEDIANIDANVTNKPSILNAQAMIFLADPWSMPGFYNQLAHHLRPSVFTRRLSADILNSVIEVFKRASNRSQEISFSLPVAIALSKSDLIPYVVTRSNNPLYRALADRQYPGNLDRAESEGIHNVVRQLLQEVDEHSLVLMEQILEHVNFSAISATGTSLDGSGKYPQIAPHRCLDPLFWVLRELEIVS
jgi:GTPase SAR1 family protein